jgi:hypothetical protein
MTRPKTSRGAAVGDLFQDGGIDVVINNLDSTPSLLRNRGAGRAGHWIGLQLIGDPQRKTPRDANGAVVYCTANGFRQRAEVASGRSYISQSDLRVHFGLGAAERVDELRIVWPNGENKVVGIPRLDSRNVVRQGGGIRTAR